MRAFAKACTGLRVVIENNNKKLLAGHEEWDAVM
jgi:hypothetical protein